MAPLLGIHLNQPTTHTSIKAPLLALQITTRIKGPAVRYIHYVDSSLYNDISR